MYLTTGRLRPTLDLAVPIRRMERFDDPMDRSCGLLRADASASRSPSIEIAGHLGLGLEWRAATRLALVAEVGYEHYPSIDTCLSTSGVITPVVGLVGRL